MNELITQIEEIRCRLTEEEIEKCKRALNTAGWVHNMEGLNSLLKDLNIPTENRDLGWQQELEAMFSKPFSLDLETLLYIVQEEKEIHVNAATDASAEMLNVFVCMGGNHNKDGVIEISNLRGTMDDFNIHMNIDDLLAELGIDKHGSLDFDEFVSLLIDDEEVQTQFLNMQEEFQKYKRDNAINAGTLEQLATKYSQVIPWDYIEQFLEGVAEYLPMFNKKKEAPSSTTARHSVSGAGGAVAAKAVLPDDPIPVQTLHAAAPPTSQKPQHLQHHRLSSGQPLLRNSSLAPSDSSAEPAGSVSEEALLKTMMDSAAGEETELSRLREQRKEHRREERRRALRRGGKSTEVQNIIYQKHMNHLADVRKDKLDALVRLHSEAIRHFRRTHKLQRKAAPKSYKHKRIEDDPALPKLKKKKAAWMIRALGQKMKEIQDWEDYGLISTAQKKSQQLVLSLLRRVIEASCDPPLNRPLSATASEDLPPPTTSMVAPDRQVDIVQQHFEGSQALFDSLERPQLAHVTYTVQPQQPPVLHSSPPSNNNTNTQHPNDGRKPNVDTDNEPQEQFVAHICGNQNSKQLRNAAQEWMKHHIDEKRQQHEQRLAEMNEAPTTLSSATSTHSNGTPNTMSSQGMSSASTLSINEDEPPVEIGTTLTVNIDEQPLHQPRQQPQSQPQPQPQTQPQEQGQQVHQQHPHQQQQQQQQPHDPQQTQQAQYSPPTYSHQHSPGYGPHTFVPSAPFFPMFPQQLQQQQAEYYASVNGELPTPQQLQLYYSALPYQVPGASAALQALQPLQPSQLYQPLQLSPMSLPYQPTVPQPPDPLQNSQLSQPLQPQPPLSRPIQLPDVAQVPEPPQTAQPLQGVQPPPLFYQPLQPTPLQLVQPPTSHPPPPLQATQLDEITPQESGEKVSGGISTPSASSQLTSSKTPPTTMFERIRLSSSDGILHTPAPLPPPPPPMVPTTLAAPPPMMEPPPPAPILPPPPPPPPPIEEPPSLIMLSSNRSTPSLTEPTVGYLPKPPTPNTKKPITTPFSTLYSKRLGNGTQQQGTFVGTEGSTREPSSLLKRHIELPDEMKMKFKHHSEHYQFLSTMGTRHPRQFVRYTHSSLAKSKIAPPAAITKVRKYLDKHNESGIQVDQLATLPCDRALKRNLYCSNHNHSKVQCMMKTNPESGRMETVGAAAPQSTEKPPSSFDYLVNSSAFRQRTLLDASYVKPAGPFIGESFLLDSGVSRLKDEQSEFDQELQAAKQHMKSQKRVKPPKSKDPVPISAGRKFGKVVKKKKKVTRVRVNEMDRIDIIEEEEEVEEEPERFTQHREIAPQPMVSITETVPKRESARGNAFFNLIKAADPAKP